MQWLLSVRVAPGAAGYAEGIAGNPKNPETVTKSALV